MNYDLELEEDDLLGMDYFNIENYLINWIESSKTMPKGLKIYKTSHEKIYVHEINISLW